MKLKITLLVETDNPEPWLTKTEVFLTDLNSEFFHLEDEEVIDIDVVKVPNDTTKL